MAALLVDMLHPDPAQVCPHHADNSAGHFCLYSEPRIHAAPAAGPQQDSLAVPPSRELGRGPEVVNMSTSIRSGPTTIQLITVLQPLPPRRTRRCAFGDEGATEAASPKGWGVSGVCTIPTAID